MVPETMEDCSSPRSNSSHSMKHQQHQQQHRQPLQDPHDRLTIDAHNKMVVSTPSTARTVDIADNDDDDDDDDRHHDVDLDDEVDGEDCSYHPSSPCVSSSSSSSTSSLSTSARLSTSDDQHQHILVVAQQQEEEDEEEEGVGGVSSNGLPWTSSTAPASTNAIKSAAAAASAKPASASTSIRFPLPSPSRYRGRLDKQYAKRLNFSSTHMMYCHPNQYPTHNVRAGDSNPRFTTATTATARDAVGTGTGNATKITPMKKAVEGKIEPSSYGDTAAAAAATTPQTVASTAANTTMSCSTCTDLDDSLDTTMTDGGEADFYCDDDISSGRRQDKQEAGTGNGNGNGNGSTFVKIIPPPGIIRQHHQHDDERMTITPSSLLSSSGSPPFFFRPTPIVKPSPLGCESDDGVHSNNKNHSESQRRRFFFPDEHEIRSTRSAATNRRAEFVTPQRRLHHNRPVVTGHREQSLTDLGVSDRFIPSRATSNTNNINLWDAINTNSTSSIRRFSSPSSSGLSSPNTAGNGVGGGGAAAGHDEFIMHGASTGGGGETGTNDAGAAAAASGETNNIVSSSSTDDLATAGTAVPGANQSSITSQQNLHNVLLRSELLGENISPHIYMNRRQQQQQNAPSSFHRGTTPSSPSLSSSSPTRTPFGDGMNRLRFQSPRQAFHDTVFDDVEDPTSVVNNFSLTPFGSASSQRLMSTPPKRRRKIAKVPFKVLDAPALQDDFYLNLVDWSSQNVLAVGLGSCVYLWSACTSKVTKLCDLNETEDVVTSVSWAQRGTHLAVGTNKGEVQLWDTIKVKRLRTMGGHSARVGTLAWTGPMLASGSRDRLIYLRDVRAPGAFTDRLSAHRQEVCGLKWSSDEPAFLASGGNDNQLHVVDSRNPGSPVHRFTDHTAAVKAITWSPHQHGLLASGGGTADRCIRFWNTLSGSCLSCVDTGSQVCNLAWSRNCNEIVSTHGYSLNQIVVWRYPSLSKVTTLTGHTYRVLYLAVSPDGSTIVTGAGDETLRFWQVFPGPRSGTGKNDNGGLLFPNTPGSVIR